MTSSTKQQLEQIHTLMKTVQNELEDTLNTQALGTIVMAQWPGYPNGLECRVTRAHFDVKYRIIFHLEPVDSRMSGFKFSQEIDYVKFVGQEDEDEI